jgi:hypothetical protein
MAAFTMMAPYGEMNGLLRRMPPETLNLFLIAAGSMQPVTAGVAGTVLRRRPANELPVDLCLPNPNPRYRWIANLNGLLTQLIATPFQLASLSHSTFVSCLPM